MKKPIIITAFNDNPTYYSFVESALQMWHNFGYEIKAAYISDSHKDEVIRATEKYGEIIKFNSINDVDSGVQSKISRMILASDENFFWIVDVDFYILNLQWWEDRFKKYTGENILAETPYNEKDPTSKWAMWSNTGSGKVLKDIINPQNLSYYELIESWKGIGQIYDEKEDVLNPFDKFSDESLMRRLVFSSGSGNRMLYIPRKRPNFLNYHINSAIYYQDIFRRVDRTWNWGINREKLLSGNYLDCFPKRPLDKKDPVIKTIFEYLKISL